VVTTARAINQVVDGIGIFAYRPRGFLPTSLVPADYEPAEVPNDLALDVHDLRHTGNTLSAATGASTKELMRRTIVELDLHRISLVTKA
jgi:hypothetical protein